MTVPVVNMFAESHVNNTAIRAGAAATDAENMKCQKYASLHQSDIFEPIAIETAGLYGQSTSHIFNDTGGRLTATAGDSRQLAWFKQ